MPTTDRKLRVFLCHASQDKPIVRELYQHLNAEGWIDPWLDEEKLLPGQDWDLEIERAVEVADAVIVCLSDSSVKKEGYIQKELRFALNVALEKPEEIIFIIPVRLDDCFVPRSIRSIQYIDYFPGGNKNIAYDRVRDSLLIRARTFGINPIAAVKSTPKIPPSALANKFTSDGHRIYVFGDIEFVRIPAGKFLMGSEIPNAISKKPKYSLFEMDIPYDYFMGRYPVTNLQYAQHYESDYRPGGGMPNSGLSKFFPDINLDENAPVVGTSLHYGGYQYFQWLNKTFKDELPDRYFFYLPSEAEWEKAARGTDGRYFPWGNKFDQAKCNTMENGKGTTTIVGSYSPLGDSPYGVTDMSGNVWEYTRSLWRNTPANDSSLLESEDFFSWRVIRGGSYKDKAGNALVTRRENMTHGTFSTIVGLRVAVVPIPKK